MKTYKRVISLEPYKSRVPGVLMALDSCWHLYHNGIDLIYNRYADAYNDAINMSVDVSNIYSDYDYRSYSDKSIISANTNGNYGHIVSDIEIPSEFISSITDFTDINVNIPLSKGNGFHIIKNISAKDIHNRLSDGELHYFYYKDEIYSIKGYNDVEGSIADILKLSTKHKYLTYSTLRKWISFFNGYIALLCSGSCKLTYKTAHDYFLYEIKDNSDESLYQGYDTTFNSRGGWKFCRWVFNNCMPKFFFRDLNDSGDTFSSDIEDYWGCKFIFYPDAIKWLSWFNERHGKYMNLKNYTERSSSDTCCDCMEYFKRGGNILWKRLNDWVKNLNVSDSISTRSASINIPIMLTVNADDMGQMTMLSSEYKEKENYASTLPDNQKMDSMSGGTVIQRPVITDNDTGNIFIDNNVYMIKDGCVGYEQNIYNENVFNRNNWVDYTSYYINKNSDEFITTATTYTYNRNGGIVFDPTVDKLAEHYQIIRSNNGYILIDGTLYGIEKKKYVIYSGDSNSLLNGMEFSVDESANGIFYTVINGNVFYAIKKGGSYYFNFKKPQRCSSQRNYDCKALPDGISFVRCIMIGEKMYRLDTYGYVTLDYDDMAYRFPKLDGYVDIDDQRYYVKDGLLVKYQGTQFVQTQSFSGQEAVFSVVTADTDNNIFYTSISGNTLNVTYPYKEYRCDTVSGKTDSKLENLKQREILTDDLGNEMPGYFISSSGSTFPQPYANCQLDVYYKVGNTSQLSKNVSLTIDGDADAQFFDGNILQSMKIYHTINGIIYDGSVITLDNDAIDNKHEKTDVLGAIKKSEDAVHEYLTSSTTDESILASDASNNYIQLWCDFTYYMGAILKMKFSIDSSGTISYEGYKLAEGKHHGVKFTDVCELNRRICTYRTIEGKSIPMYYYSIDKPKKTIKLNTYGNQRYTVDSTIFEMDIRLIRKGENNVLTLSNDEFNANNGFNQLNGMIASPMFRREYDFGTTFQQNIDSDIYIDRGINFAIDKHIRLQEIKNIDVLTQYQNGSLFNVIES